MNYRELVNSWKRMNELSSVWIYEKEWMNYREWVNSWNRMNELSGMYGFMK